MGQTNIFKNKFYLALLGSWLGLYLLQMILAFAGVRGNTFSCVLAVLYGIVVALMLGVGYVRRERTFLLLAGVCATIQVILFLFSIPMMVTGKDLLPKALQCLLHIPGYSLMSAPYGWRWAFAIFWGVIFCGSVEGMWKGICAAFSNWRDARWQERHDTRK